MIKAIPNILSVMRIFLSCSLLFIFQNKVGFIIVYVSAGLTDVLDGFIARKYKMESKLGAKLDSIADLIFYSILLAIFFIWYQPILLEYKWLILAILLIRVWSIIFGIIKYRNAIFIHTIANKAAGLMLFCIPIYLKLSPSLVFILIALIISIISALEESMIIMLFKNVEPNRKSIFFS